MEENVMERIRHQVGFLEKNKNSLIIDADTHITDMDNLPEALARKYESTPDYFHGRPVSGPDLLAEMSLAGVDMSLVWQNPSATPYTGDKDNNYRQLLESNEYIFRMVHEYPEKFIPAGWTDPKALGKENAARIVEKCILEFGFPIVKMNPAQNAYPIDSKEVFSIVEKIAELNGMVAFHYGADTPYTPADGLEKIARTFPETRIIGVHMGGGGAGYVEGEDLYIRTRELGLEYENLFFIQSAKRDTHIESDFIAYTLAGAPFNKNIACASDAPYGRQTWNFGGYRLMFASLANAESHTDARVREKPDLFNTEMIKDYMGRNFAELIIHGYRKTFDLND